MRRSISIRAFCLLLVFSFDSFASEKTKIDSPGCGALLLTLEQQATLQLVSSSRELEVKIMQPPDSRKLLILIGEAHIVPPEDANAASKVVQNFNTFGAELSGVNRTWAKKSGLFTLGMILGLPEALLQMTRMKMTRNGPASLLQSEMKVGMGPGRTVVDIEDSHQPGIAENLAILLLSVDMGTSGVCALATCLYAFNTWRPESGWTAFGAAVTWLGFKGYEYLLKSPFFTARPDLRDRLSYLSYLTKGRDPSMSSGINSLVESNVGVTVSIFGKAHLPGIIEALRSKGYAEIDLPQNQTPK